jgi:hypothetical protein
VQLKGLDQFKDLMTSCGIEPATFPLEAIVTQAITIQRASVDSFLFEENEHKRFSKGNRMGWFGLD